jgi:hypothetical protein
MQPLAVLLTFSALVCHGLAIGAWSVDQGAVVRPVMALGCALAAVALLLTV